MFNIKKTTLVLIITMSALIKSNVLIAADFTLNIPVKFSELHQNIKFIETKCELRGNEPNSDGSSSLRQNFGSKIEPVLNGSFDKVVSIVIDSSTADYVSSWRCYVRVCLESRHQSCQVLSATTTNSVFKAAPGSTLVTYRSGTL